MKTAEDIQKALAEPFMPFEIEWRIQQAGIDRNNNKWAMVLAYITNRAIMERLDDVFGIQGWQNEYKPMPDGGIICGLSCWVPSSDGVTKAWITKYDGADKTAIEATKGGLSNAMKRAGVQWGIGRYLYGLDTTFVKLIEGRPEGGDHIPVYIKEFTPGKKDGGPHYFERPKLPSWALPKEKKK